MSDYTIKDSGKRQEFPTGSVRDTSLGKGRYDLLPAYALSRVAKHFESGAAKYNPRNWELGQPLCRYLDSAIRHLFNFLGGDRSEDHLSAAVFNALALIETEYRIACGNLPPELNDLPLPEAATRKVKSPLP